MQIQSYCDSDYGTRQFIFIQNCRFSLVLCGGAMADEIKAEYKRLQEKKRPKNNDTLEVDEFEWIQVISHFLPNFLCF